MIKHLPKDYSKTKEETQNDEDVLTQASARGSDYVAFDIQGNLNQSGSELHVRVKEDVDFMWLLRSCIEEALSFFLEWAPLTIILFFMTKMYSQEIVSGFGLGLVWLNCMGQGLFYGVGSGLETMASHAHGAENYQQIGLLFNKTLFISSIMFLPISILMFNADTILTLWNDNPNLCRIAGQFCAYSIPGIGFSAIYYSYKGVDNNFLGWVVCSFILERRIVSSFVYSSGINAMLTVLYCILFIQVLDLDIVGAALVFSISQFSNLTLCCLFARRKEHLRHCFIPITRRCFQDIKPFLKTLIPIGSLVSLEWILQELNSIIASSLPEEQYSANIVLANLTSTCVQFPLGYATAACTFIGNEMGKGNVSNAKRYALYSCYILVSHLILTIIPILLLKDSIADAFAVDEKVRSELLRIIILAVTVYSLDAIQSLVTAFMRAIAKERYSSISFILCYALIGLTSSYYLAYHTSLQIQGVWFGIILSMSLYIVLQVAKISITDLHSMANRISLRISFSQEESLLPTSTT